MKTRRALIELDNATVRLIIDLQNLVDALEKRVLHLEESVALSAIYHPIP